MPDEQPPPSRLRRLKETWREVEPFLAATPGKLVAISLLSIGAGLLEAAVLVLIVQIGVAISAGDDAVQMSPPLIGDVSPTVGTLFWITLGLSVVRLTLVFAEAYLPARMASDAQVNLQKSAFGAFLDANWATASQDGEGHLVTLLTTNITRSSNAVLQASVALSAALSLVALVVTAVAIQPAAAIATLVSVGAMFLAFRPLSRRGSTASRIHVDTNKGYIRATSEAARLAEDVAVLGGQPGMGARLDGMAENVEKSGFTVRFLAQLIPTLYRSIAIVLVVLGLAAIYLIAGSELTTLGAIVLVLLRALNYAQTMQGGLHRLGDLYPYISQVNADIDRYRAAAVPGGSRPLDAIADIELTGIGYAYTTGLPVLRGVDIALRRGEMLGIVGPSGSGKSTLSQILLGLRDPDEGAYLVNGAPAAEYLRTDWRRQVAYVPQDTKVFAGTIRENIVFFRDGVSDDDIVRATRLAELHDDIERLPRGYDTVIGQQADALSGGQRQRLCIARALVTRPSMLLLDEPTSALDPLSESKVREALEGLRGDTTVIIVAHRMSTIEQCDRILVLERGAVAVAGTVEDALTGSEYFRRALAGGAPA